MSEAKPSGLIARLDKLNEFERQPVTPDKFQGGRHFAGVFSGEHVAATEFVIGALFVSKGAHTCDVIVGLIFGNLLAVLSWALICAPIAIRTRLTLYWYLRKIAGPVVMIIYNILNAVMYCILAGSMITVSASAIRIAFGIPIQLGWWPTDPGFVVLVLVIGAVVVTLAILGFKRLAEFSEVCSPWMFLMFIAGALALMPAIISSMPELGSLHSFYDFWRLADAKIWPGPHPGQTETFGFLNIVFFAWICNLAMHLGLSDMALFRFAKSSTYGFYSAFGMYLGHYLAWVCAGIMGAGAAIILKTPLIQLDSGEVAVTALGIAGALAVVLAGWTTANPTIYRAGLALQIVTPNWPRWIVTLIAGTVTTIVACSPWVFTKLLNFIGLYGLLLMPIGAIVFVEHWIFPKIGLAQYWISRKGLLVSWPALLAWFITLAGGVFAWYGGYIDLFFLIIPMWFSAAILYIIFAAVSGAAEKLPPLAEDITQTVQTAATQQTVKASPKRDPLFYISGFIAISSLIACFVMAMWVAVSGAADYDQRLKYFKVIVLYPTVIYFVSGIIWFYLKDKGEATSHM
jgi:NCS1 family nucleobase:cation symporter-1